MADSGFDLGGGGVAPGAHPGTASVRDSLKKQVKYKSIEQTAFRYNTG